MDEAIWHDMHLRRLTRQCTLFAVVNLACADCLQASYRTLVIGMSADGIIRLLMADIVCCHENCRHEDRQHQHGLFEEWQSHQRRSQVRSRYQEGKPQMVSSLQPRRDGASYELFWDNQIPLQGHPCFPQKPEIRRMRMLLYLESWKY